MILSVLKVEKRRERFVTKSRDLMVRNARISFYITIICIVDKLKVWDSRALLSSKK
jgi:hypothetical protein